MPGQSGVPGGDAWTMARGSGVCCQIAAALGGSGGRGSPGARTAARRTRRRRRPRVVARSTTKSPTAVAPGGSGTSPSTRTAPGGAPCSSPTWSGEYGNRKMPGSGVTTPASSAGIGPAKTTHRPPVGVRLHA